LAVVFFLTVFGSLQSCSRLCAAIHQPHAAAAALRYETIKAADAVAALKASLKPVATAKRDGQWKNLDAKELVPGDMVLLGAGSAIPAGELG
jgi:magnesium-transporting ATPase (P-type)